MDYKRIYKEIIERAKTRQRFEGYAEHHHILPKCMGGGLGDNIVRLTAREHFICHMLLTKIYPGSKMSYALWRMVNTKKSRLKISSRTYERIRNELKHSEESKKKMSIKRKGKPSNSKGKKRTEESKKKMSIVHIGLPSSRKGKHHTEEAKEKIRQKHLGKKHSEEHKRKIAESNKGKHYNKGCKHKKKRLPISEETRKRLSESHKGQTAWNKGLKGQTAWNKGIPCSEESKKKQIETKRNKKLTSYSNE